MPLFLRPIPTTLGGSCTFVSYVQYVQYVRYELPQTPEVIHV